MLWLTWLEGWFVSVFDWSICSLYRWQTLLAGFLALLGAGWTVRGIRGQIAQNKEQIEQTKEQIRQANDFEMRRQAREERAARAALPLALSDIIQYSMNCIRLLARCVPDYGAPLAIPLSLRAPEMPEKALGRLQAVARAEEPDIAKKAMTVLGKFQVQNARLKGLITRSTQNEPHVMSINEGKDAMCDAADLYAAASELFSYARDEDAVRQHASADKLKTAFRNADIWADDHPSVYEWIDAKYSPDTNDAPPS